MQQDVSRNPGLLKLDLFCKGIRVDESCRLGDDSRGPRRERAEGLREFARYLSGRAR